MNKDDDTIDQEEYFYNIAERIGQLNWQHANDAEAHLYDWLQKVYPEVFKQWGAVYDIERNI